MYPIDIGTMYPIDIGRRRSGRPRIKWIGQTISHARKRITDSRYTRYRNTQFDPDNPAHVNTFTQAFKNVELGYITRILR